MEEEAFKNGLERDHNRDRGGKESMGTRMELGIRKLQKRIHTGKPGDGAGQAGQHPTVSPEQEGKAPTFNSDGVRAVF